MTSGPAPSALDGHVRALVQAGRLGEAAAALKSAGRLQEALDLRLRAVERQPDSVAAHHNLAALLGDMGRHQEALEAVNRAVRRGGDAPETHLVRARSLQGLNLYDEAEAAFRAALARRPLYGDVLKELSQLIWMRTGDLEAALAPVEAALAQLRAQGVAAGPLHLVKGALLEFGGLDSPTAYARLKAGGAGGDGAGELALAHAALHGLPDDALRHVEAAARLAPADAQIGYKRAEVRLARREPEAALDLTRPMLARDPLDQYALGLTSTALRMLGDPTGGGLEDYAGLVVADRLDVPEGWPDLPAYLADLARSLRALHGLKTHPVGQSLRHGTQTTVSLENSDDPAVRAVFQALDGPIRRRLASLGTGDDPVRRRNTGDYRYNGVWSVQLQPGGFHTSHFHPKGWLSSACYIELPPVIEAGGREGWIAFGEPPLPTGLTAGHHEKPEPGKLVLFPSYMWHGTVPFSGDRPRLTMAFDLVPA